MSDIQWIPRTSLGKKVIDGEIKSIDEILSTGKKILEPEIVDFLITDLENEFLLIGQGKGRFGRGQRKIARNTQLVTSNGTVMSFGTCVVVGNNDGIVGIGFGKSRDTNPSKDKAMKGAKLSLIRVKRGCGSWECACNLPHTVPYLIQGKSGSTQVILFPAPRGTGLVCHEDVAKILRLAGYKDVWMQVKGKASTRINLIKATFDALRKLSYTKVLMNEEGVILSGPSSNLKD